MSRKIFKLKIKEIADLSEIFPLWKVHWLGELSSNGRTRELLIDLWMVPYKSPKLYNHKILSVVQNEEYNFNEMRTVQIGVGQLPIVGIGSFFKNGEPLARTNFISQTFKLTPTADNQTIINLSDSWTDENQEEKFYVPTNQFRVHRTQSDNRNIDKGQTFIFSEFSRNADAQRNPANLLKGKCLLVKSALTGKRKDVEERYPFDEPAWRHEAKGNPSKIGSEYDGLVIPCIELGRFYYAGSSQMFHQIFTDGLLGTDNRVFIGSKSKLPDKDGNNGFVHLAKGVTNFDLPYVARAIFEPDGYALKQFRNIYLSLLKADLIKNGRVPEIYFPYINRETKLKVHGTPIQSGSKRFFFVYWIESCTAAFPFKNLDYWRDFPGGMDRPIESTDFEGNPNQFAYTEDYSPIEATFKRNRYQSSTLEMTSAVPGSQARATIEMLLPLNKFPDLQSKHWSPQNPHPKMEKLAYRRRINLELYSLPEPVEFGTTAPRDGVQKVTKATITTVLDSQTGDTEVFADTTINPRVKLFMQIASMINSKTTEVLKHFSARLIYILPGTDKILDGSQPTEFPPLKLEIEDDRNRTTINRLAKMDVRITEIVYQLKDLPFYAYLFDIIPPIQNLEQHCMCLTFKEDTPTEFTVAEIRKILIDCLDSNGTWFTTVINSTEEDFNGNIVTTAVKDLKMQRTVDKLRLIKIRHQSDKPKFYVKNIVKKLRAAAHTLRVD